LIPFQNAKIEKIYYGIIQPKSSRLGFVYPGIPKGEEVVSYRNFGPFSREDSFHPFFPRLAAPAEGQSHSG